MKLYWSEPGGDKKAPAQYDRCAGAALSFA